MPQSRRKIAGKVIEILHKGVVDEHVRQPNLGELAQHFFHIAGGEKAIAKMLLDEYRNPNTSPMVRSKIMQVMLAHLKWLNEKTGVVDDMQNLTDEDIKRELNLHIAAVSDDMIENAVNPQDERPDERLPKPRAS